MAADEGRDEVVAAVADSAAAARFRGPALFSAARPALEGNGLFREAFREAEDTPWLGAALIRASFLSEPVNEEVTSTKFSSRWAPRFASDPRHASPDECWAIFERLLEGLRDCDRDGPEFALLRRFRKYSALAYELPVDYREQLERGVHRSENVRWIWGVPEVEKALRLREAVANPEVVGGELVEFFSKVRKKVGVKTYLTDRSQTGVAKTNREKRWEAHPASVQFALRRDCLGIERKLLEQVCFFDGFPPAVREAIDRHAGLDAVEDPFRCPITRDPLIFPELRKELMDPSFGKAAFQVGHLDPLKGTARVVPSSPSGSAARRGHSAENVSWISADGNRIQGALSLSVTQDLLGRIASNYLDHPPPRVDDPPRN